MNKLYELAYKGRINLVEYLGLPEDEEFKTVHNERWDILTEVEEKFLDKLSPEQKREYDHITCCIASADLIEVHGMFIEGIRVGLDLARRKSRKWRHKVRQLGDIFYSTPEPEERKPHKQRRIKAVIKQKRG